MILQRVALNSDFKTNREELKMEALIPIFRLMHFIGFALLLGGTLCSILLVRKEAPSIRSASLAYNCMHLVATPGLTLLLLTGVLHSTIIYWDNFKGAGYMHLKVSLVLLILVLVIFDMRTQKKIIRSNPEADVLSDMIKKRQALALGVCVLTLLIMWLVSFRPF